MRVKDALSVGIFALATSLALPAHAQDDAAAVPQTEELEADIGDIVVTAQFRETRLQDTPLAITAVNAALLEQRGQTDISQVAAQAPNVTLKPQPQNGGAGLIAFIRGVGQVDFNYALDPGVGVYVDDVYIPTLSSSMLDLMDLERIEILRGPQGTLAGKNSIGGAIKLFSVKPDGSGRGSLSVGYGSYNKLDIRGMADFAVTDNLFARVSGVAKSSKGYVDVLDYGRTHPNSNVLASNARGANEVVGTQGGQSYVAGRLALRWIPTDTLEINLSGDFTSDKSEPVPTLALAAGQPTADANDFNPNTPFAATNVDGDPWLRGKDGNAVPLSCAFVPYGKFGCDTANFAGLGVDPRYATYSTFVDGMTPTSQAPYKPYSALQNQDFTGWGLQGNVTLDLSDTLQLVWISSYRAYESSWGQDQDATPIPVAQLDNKMNHHAWSQEIRLNGSLADKMIEYTLGGFYFDQNGRYTARVDLNYAGIDFIHGPDTTPSDSKALFANGTFHVTEAWGISGGIRYTEDKKTYTYYRSNPDGTVPFEDWNPTVSPAPICEAFLGMVPGDTSGTAVGNTPNCLLTGLYGISDTFQGKRWDWRISTDYRFSDAFMMYGSIATGYKGGGVNPRPFFGPSAGDCNASTYVAPAPCNQLGSFQPETIVTYEVGFKSDLFDRKVRLNGAVFFNKYDDIILQLSACPSIPCQKPANVGKAEVKGFELETTIRPLDGLTLDGSLSYIDFKYTDIGQASVPITGRTPFTPHWSNSFGIQYDYRINPGTVSFRFDGNYQSDIYSEASNTDWSRVKPYFLGNARLSFTTADRDWRVALEVQNVFNHYYFLSKSDVSSSLGVVTGVPALPRTWMLSVKRNF